MLPRQFHTDGAAPDIITAYVLDRSIARVCESKWNEEFDVRKGQKWPPGPITTQRLFTSAPRPFSLLMECYSAVLGFFRPNASRYLQQSLSPAAAESRLVFTTAWRAFLRLVGQQS